MANSPQSIHDNSGSEQPSALKSLKNFGIGVGLGSIPSLTFFSYYVYMNHIPFAHMIPLVGGVRIGVAIAVPLLCGLAGAIWGDRALEVIGNALENSPL